MAQEQHPPCDCAVEIFGLSPLANALQAEYMHTIGQYAEAMLTIHLFRDHLKANATRFIL